MKKILLGLILIVSSLEIFGNTLDSVSLSSSRFTVALTDNISDAPVVEYDKQNRLLYLEFPNTYAGAKYKAKTLKNNYIENVEVVDHGGAIGVFLTLAPNVSYKTSKVGNRYNVTLSTKKRQVTLVIDAGHGGHDPGAKNRTYQEKIIALNIAKYLSNDLAKDFKIIMTRKTDVFIPLSDRPKIGNEAKADFFISVHINAAPNKNATGSEVYYFSTEKPSAYAAKMAAFENSFAELGGDSNDNIKQIMGSLAYKKNQELSVRMAQLTVNAMAEAMNAPNRGIHGANFAVLRGFDGPGVLLEVGYLSNSADLKKMVTTRYQRAVATALAREIRAYFE